MKLNEGLEKEVNLIIKQHAPSLLDRYSWDKGDLSIPDKGAAKSIIDNLKRYGDFGPMRFNPNHKIIEFGIAKQFSGLWKRYTDSYEDYVEKFESFQIHPLSITVAPPVIKQDSKMTTKTESKINELKRLIRSEIRLISENQANDSLKEDQINISHRLSIVIDPRYVELNAHYPDLLHGEGRVAIPRSEFDKLRKYLDKINY